MPPLTRSARSPFYAVDENVPIDHFPRFFEDARLNFAENLLCGDDDELAVITMGEANLWSPQRYSWRELRQLVGKYASALRRSGVKQGEVVTSKCSSAPLLYLSPALVDSNMMN